MIPEQETVVVIADSASRTRSPTAATERSTRVHDSAAHAVGALLYAPPALCSKVPAITADGPEQFGRLVR
jgi:hypothetical protein